MNRWRHALRSWLLMCSCVVLAMLPAAARGAVPDQVHWTIMGPTAVTFDWRGDDTQVQYGTQPGDLTSVATAGDPTPVPDGAGPFREARLTGLSPGSRYYYRIGDGPVHTFETPPPRGTSGFWFAQQADVGSSRSYPPVAAMQALIATDHAQLPGDDRPAFVIVNGDLTYGDQGNLANVDQHFNDVMAWSQDAAYMPSWGNHDWDPAGSLKADQANNYKGRFAFPNARRSPGTGTVCIAKDTSPGEDWYWFDYGNVRFIASPPGSEGLCGYAGARVAWRLAADSLMDAVDDDPAIRFVVTFGHFPPYSSGADHGGDPVLASDLAVLRALHAKYALHLSGHSHHYERFDPEQTFRVQHVLSGGGGSVLGALGPPLLSTVARVGHTHQLKIRVASDRIEGFAICGPDRPEQADSCPPGTIIDSWSIVSAATTDAPPVAAPRIVRAGWYDVLGRRVEPGAPGAYFRPGKPRVIIR